MPKPGFKHSLKTKRLMSANRLTRHPVLQRFWSRVKKEPGSHCWMWTGDPGVDGYGRIWVVTRSVLAHRYSWILHYGNIPKGKWVLHKCDTVGCVRPDHLFLGTPRDNIEDMLKKGRSLRGERHNLAKLNESQVIRVLQWKQGEGQSLRELAQELGVGLGCLGLIRSGITWKHLYHHHSRFNLKV
jgi:hypothetical protein